MEREESKNINPQSMGLDKESKRRFSISEYKKQMGLDQIPVVHKPIIVKKDGQHLYQVAGYFYPVRWETLERLNIPNQRILFEVDRDEWIKEMKEARKKQGETLDEDMYPWGNEE